ncbi:hypothetical protein [Sulfurimonas sp.]|uniref:hypothetical protein n=1 Tax=Sulfurimonas sp. TaxID=2022749 RepID=UPI003D0B5831
MNSKQDTPTDKIYQLNFYNSNGIIDTVKLRQYSALLFFTLFITALFITYIFENMPMNEIVPALSSIEFYQQFFSFHYDTIYNAVINKISLESKYIYTLGTALTVAIVPTLYMIYRVSKASKFQAILSSVGLSQYYYHKRKGKNIYLKFKKGQKNNFKTFIAQQENLTQMLKKESLQFKRWKENGVIIQYSDQFPSIEELSKLQVKNFIKPDKLFLGIGLPLIGEEYNKQDLIKNRYLPRYLNFSDIPQGSANLGSAGGGKSNSMNQYLYSIFANFDKIEAFYMIDFKGGIEAEPIKDLEHKFQTGKIEVFDDNRVALYKALKRLNFINKARMRYLKANKKKKFSTDFIVLIFDELAEILDYIPSTKEERKMQDMISFYLESLLRTGRSQGFKIFYSTQSYLSSASGLSSGMKNNTKLKIAHQLGSNLQVGSIKPVEELNEIGVFPTKYDIGKNVVINEADNTIYEVRSLYVPDNFIEEIEINSQTNESLQQELKPHYEAVYEEMVQDLNQTGQEDDTIYSLQNIASDLGLPRPTNEETTVTQEKITPIEPIAQQKEKPKISIAKAIHAKKTAKTETSANDEANFLESLK